MLEEKWPLEVRRIGSGCRPLYQPVSRPWVCSLTFPGQSSLVWNIKVLDTEE